MDLQKVKNYLFIAYEMYIKEKTKKEIDNLYGFSLVMEMDDYTSWLKKRI